MFTAQHPFTNKVSYFSYRTAHQLWHELTDPHPELRGIRLHDLRHTFATERVRLMRLEQLRALMGHQNIQTTLRYQKVISKQAKSAAQQAFKSLLNRDDTSRNSI